MAPSYAMGTAMGGGPGPASAPSSSTYDDKFKATIRGKYCRLSVYYNGRSVVPNLSLSTYMSVDGKVIAQYCYMVLASTDK